MHSENSSPSGQTHGIIGMGLIGSAVQRMTGAQRGWDIDPQRCLHASTADEVFGTCGVVFLCLPDSHIVREVLISASLCPGQILVDTTTGDPQDTMRLGAELANRGVHYLDATISGSSAQVLQKEVVVMVGGASEAIEACRGLLQAFAREVIAVGACGNGAKMKLVTNLVLGLNRAALAEGLTLANELNLDLLQTLQVMRSSMAYSRIMDTKGEKMIRQDFTPQARLSQHLKDVRLMLSASSLPLPLTETHRQLLEKAEALGFGDADNSAVIKALNHP